MSGNVYEWCFDYFDTYDSTLQTNPKGPLKGNSRGRVIRGGSWYGSKESCKSSSRYFIRQTHCDYVIGFRPILRL